jgi:hypothetical protein
MLGYLPHTRSRRLSHVAKVAPVTLSPPRVTLHFICQL